MPKTKKLKKPQKPVVRSPRWYGWQPDLPDHRDFLYAAIKPKGVRLPRSKDLRQGCSPIEDQEALGSCTANALVGALEFLELKAGAPFTDLSRLFVYYNERVIEATVDVDSGAYLRDGIKTLAKQGVCTEESWPYVISDFTNEPTAACYQEAVGHVISDYHRLNTVDEMRACLNEGFPFVFGFSVYAAFESKAVEKSGVLDLPDYSREAFKGGHAVLAVGYDDDEERFWVRNSWGKKWGQDGYFSMPYDYLADRNLSDDFWTVRK